MPLKRYVAGLLFSQDKKRVALVRKNRPEWQAGYLNAIGGKIEGDETPLEAQYREFQEETGASVPNWSCFLTIKGEHSEVSFFRARGTLEDLKTTTDEAIEIHEVAKLKADGYPMCIHNLEWILPLALTSDFFFGDVAITWF